MGPKAEDLTTLLSNPDLAAEKADLLYISEEQLSIERKKKRDSFEFFHKGKSLKRKKDLERINKLVIPPAWEDVKISPIENSHLQVIGKDAKGRKQYMYHPLWTRLRNQTKFYKMASFGKILPKIRKQVDEDLDLHGMPQRKVLALVIRLMEETHIRIGNSCYARENKSYGLSTLRSRHLEISRGQMRFNFMGKKGKEHSVSVRDKQLIKLVNRCEEIPGWEIFKYYDQEGKKQVIDSGMVNEYIQGISGEHFSAKDFRTWSATKIFFEELRKQGHAENEKEIKSNILKACDTTADALNNTRSVCRTYYIHPRVTEAYQSGEIIPYFKKVERKRTSKPHFSQTEEIILELISDFEIDLREED